LFVSFQEKDSAKQRKLIATSGVWNYARKAYRRCTEKSNEGFSEWWVSLKEWHKHPVNHVPQSN